MKIEAQPGISKEAQSRPEEVFEGREGGLSSERLDSLYKEAVEELNQFRPNMVDFLNDYPEELVYADIDKADLLEAEWEFHNKKDPESFETKKLATVAEYMLFKHMRTWSREKILTLMPSRYDDYVRGVDIILEFPQQNVNDSKYHALSIDVVLGSNEAYIEKLMTIKKFVIDAGYKKNGPKYFKPDGEKLFKGFMVPGIVSFTPHNIEKLVEYEATENVQGIDKSITPYIVFTQLLEQYRGFEEYARSVGAEEIADLYKQAAADLEDASNHFVSELFYNKNLNEAVENNRAVKNTKTFFRLLKSGEYMDVPVTEPEGVTENEN